MANKRAGDESAAAGTPNPIVSLIQVVTGPWTRENGMSWVKLTVFVLMVWWLLIQPFRIPSQSMHPTLNGDPGFFVGDRVFVNKLAFGPRIPFTDIRLWGMGHPRRFDVVVFRAIADNTPNNTVLEKTINFFLPKVLIKRVIGLPGDRVFISNGRVYINNQAIELPDAMKKIPVEYTNNAPLDFQMGNDKFEAQLRAQGQTDAQVKEARDAYSFYCSNINEMKYGCLQDDKYSVVPPGHYFVMGDNSPNSFDSRYWGWVPENWMFGRAFCVWWPFSHRKDLSGFTQTFTGMLLLIAVPGILLAYEFLIRPFLAVSLRVRVRGMSGALKRGDRVLINRLAYGLRRPFSDKRLTAGRTVQRGELVAYFVPGGDDTAASGEALLGRVAGVPGDSMTVESGMIAVNGQVTGVRFNGQEKGGPIRLKRTGTIPQGRYLLLAGSEDSVPDSRIFGFIAHDLLIGPAAVVWWPPYRIRPVGRER